jgi:hypothetical protein
MTDNNDFTVMRPTLMLLCHSADKWMVKLRMEEEDFVEGFERTLSRKFDAMYEGDYIYLVTIYNVRSKDLLNYERFRVRVLRRGILLTAMPQNEWERMLTGCIRANTGALDHVMEDAA